jgi:rhamnosyltransferase subunit B
MSRKVLLAWELGGGLGHAVRLVAVSESLARRGFDPVLVARRPDSFQIVGLEAKSRAALQAPLWPGLLPGASQPVQGPQASLGDSLGDLGLTDAPTITSLIREWDRIFASVRPLALVAEFAPASLLAAAGKIPSVAVGNGYTLPPPSMPDFPLLRSDVSARKYEEPTMLRAVNRALAACGRMDSASRASRRPIRTRLLVARQISLHFFRPGNVSRLAAAAKSLSTFRNTSPLIPLR